jgi:TonB family protein
MEATVNYLLQSGIALLVLYLFYKLVLRNEPSHTFNRLYLLLAPVAALLIPLLQLPLPVQPLLSATEIFPVVQLQEVQVTGYATAVEQSQAPLFTFGQLALLLYGAVGLFLIVRLTIQVLRIRRLAAAAIPVPSAQTAATLLQTKGETPAFAFLHYVFLGNQAHLSEKEQAQVLRHELAHVRLLHTYDVLYYELLTALLWFNPLVWLLKNELRDVHEFQADAEVLTDAHAQEYTALLAKEALVMAGIPIGSYFQKPQVFRRLRMLQQHGKPTSTLRLLLALPVVLLLTVAFSVNNVNADTAQLLEEPAALTELLVTAPARVAGIPVGKPQASGTVTQEAAPQTPPPATASVTKKETKFAEPIRSQENEASDKVKPYTYVEQMPQFKGGDTEMMKFLARNIRYPKDAQEAGAEGLAVVSFVVDKDGSLHDITLLKSLHESLDKEAMRVVEAMQGQWTPGSQNGELVPVRYTLPVRFAMK